MSETEYAVDIVDKNGKFLEQVDVFGSYEEANEFLNDNDVELKRGEQLNLIFIDYSDNGDEIQVGSIV